MRCKTLNQFFKEHQCTASEKKLLKRYRLFLLWMRLLEDYR